MTDELAADPFSDLLGGDTQQPAVPETPLAPPTPGVPENDPFADLLAAPPAEETSGLGAFMHGFNRALAPAAGSLLAAGYGAEVGMVGGPWGAFAGALIGGWGGASAVDAVQEFALKAMPEQWQDFLGQSDKIRAKEAEEHPTESFLGGAVPYLLTMKPFGAPASLPANATALQRILANPTTGRIFSGALNGGLEVAMEATTGQPVDPSKVAISTGLGVLFPHANRLGVKLSTMGATAARRTIPAVGLRAAQAEIAARKAPAQETAAAEPPQSEPTIAEAGDLRVMGPGVTEGVFMGTVEPSPHAAQTAQEAARAEMVALNPEVGRGDVRTVARQMEPELFDEADALGARRADLRDRANELADVPGTEAELAAINAEIQAADVALRDMAPQVAAAHRRAADYVTAETVEPDTTPAALETETVAAREAAEATGQPPIEAQIAAIAEDVTRAMMAAGRPEAEARAAGQLLSRRYLTRAARIGRGDPLALYNAEGPVIRGTRPAAPRAPLMPTINEPVIGRVAQSAAPVAEAAPTVAPERSAVAPSEIESIDPANIEVDAKRFQFKAGGDESGVTERLQGVERWDPRLAGTALVYRDAEGRNFIADGHQRVGLAKRLSATQPGIKINAFVLNAADGITDADARAIAAVKNIAEGTGTAIDAAKVIREAKATGIDLPPLPPRSALVRDGNAIANLSPEAFGIIVNEVVPVQQGAVVGRLVGVPEQQVEALRLLAKLKPDNVQQAEMIVRDMLSTGTTEGRMESLFGTEDYAGSIVLERAKIADEALKLLRKDKATFRTLVDEAERIQSTGGNVLDQATNQSRLSTDEQAADFLKQLAFRAGPVSDALSEVARKLKSGDIKSGEAARTFLGDVRRAVEAGVVTGDDAGGVEHGAAGERPLDEGPTFFQNKPAPWKPGDMLGEFNTERGLEGLPQAVIPGAEVTDTDRLKVAMSKPLKGGNAPPPRGGLFDVEGRQAEADQLTLFQPAPPEDSPAFAKWFGDSKVVDESGAPLVVYHGTRAGDFDAFDPERTGSASDFGWFGKGIYFAPDPEQASLYAQIDEKVSTSPRAQGNVYPVYIKAENPYITDEQALTQAAVDDLRAEGYDAIFRVDYPSDAIPKEIVIFDPAQIKSKFNRGTFDPNDPRIFYQPAYHGTPHIFDKFDSSKIGTGEGAQAFGHGLYFAGRKEVAEFYRKGLTPKELVRNFREALPDDADFADVMELVGTGHFTPDQERVLKALEADGWLGFDYPSQAISAAYSKNIDNWDPSPELREAVKAGGRLLTVDIPGDDELLVWDAPLSEQPEKVREAVEKLIPPIDFGHQGLVSKLTGNKPLAGAAPDGLMLYVQKSSDGTWRAEAPGMGEGMRMIAKDLPTVDAAKAAAQKWSNDRLTGEQAYTAIARSFRDMENLPTNMRAAIRENDARASAALREAGIPGHKFLDQGSRDVQKRVLALRDEVRIDEAELRVDPNNPRKQEILAETKRRLADQEAKIAHNYVIYDDSRINVTGYEQRRGRVMDARGYIRPDDHGLYRLITLSKDADSSTFLHESGHQWLEELMRDAVHEQASDVLKTDAATVRKWLGVKEGGKLQRAQHEKFATAFEQYLREGTAPSAGLARVFAQFKSWLTSIYQTLRGLGAPINDDIKQVFDRMIELEPQRTVIAPEAEAPRGMADLHANDAELTPAEEAEPAMDRVLSERDRAISEMPVEVRNELEAASAAFAAPVAGGEAGAGPGGPDQVVDAGGVTEPQPAGAARGGEPSAVDGGGGEAGSQGAGATPAPAPEPGLRDNGPGAADAARANPLAPEPAALYGRADDTLIDKAGNIRLDTLTDDVDVRNAIKASAAANNDFIGDRRGVITLGQQQDLAEALGMTAESLSQRKIGEAFNAEQVWAARKLLIQSGENVVALAKRAATGSDQDVLAYAQAAERHRMIQSQIAGITAEAGRALAAFRNMKGLTQTKTLDQLVRESTAKTLFQLKQEAALGALLDSPQAVSKFMIEKAEKRGVFAGALEWWINALVSGPRTHVTNLVSNTLFGLQRMGPDTIAAAALGEIRAALGQKRQRVQFAEVGAKFQRLPEASATGAVAAIDALKAGKSIELPSEQNQPELPYQPGSELAAAPKLDLNATSTDILPRAFGLTRGILDSMIATGKLVGAGGEAGAPLLGLKRSPLGVIPDIQYRGATVAPVGTLARLPTRLLAAEDSFFRSVLYRTEIGALAMRQAIAEGHVGASREARIADLYQNPTKEMMELAVREAAAGTFTARRSKFVNMLTQLANQNIGGMPILRFIVPFINTPANILEQTALHRTPLGLVLKGEVQNDLLGRNGDIAQDQAWGRLLVGTAYIIGFGALAAQGYLNGSGPSDPSERAAWRMAGNQPNSVRIGDTWYDMRALGPLGLLASMSADSVDVAKIATEGDAVAVASNLMNAVTQNFLNASFMTGPSDFIQAVQNPDRYGEAYIEKLVSSFTVPSLVAQPARAADPFLRDVQGTWDAILARTPASTSLQPRIDIWGNPISSGTSLGPGGISPIYTTQLSKDPVTLYLASSGYWPSAVPRKIRGVELTGQQYVEFATLAGRMMKQRLDVIVNSPQFAQWPPNSRLDIVREVIAQSRETARGYMIVRNPQLAIDAVRLKQGANAENLD